MVFWRPEVFVGEVAAFQLVLTLPPTISIIPLPIVSLAIYAGTEGEAPAVILNHAPSTTEILPSTVQVVNLGDLNLEETHEMEADLRWNAGSSIVFTGRITSETTSILKVALPSSTVLS